MTHFFSGIGNVGKTTVITVAIPYYTTAVRESVTRAKVIGRFICNLRF